MTIAEFMGAWFLASVLTGLLAGRTFQQEPLDGENEREALYADLTAGVDPTIANRAADGCRTAVVTHWKC